MLYCGQPSSQRDLGTGESGKSTIFKQMQILASVAFTVEQKTMFKHVLRRNTVECMQTLIEGAEKFEFDLAEVYISNPDIILMRLCHSRIMWKLQILLR